MKNTAQQEIESLENLSPKLVEKFLDRLESFGNNRLYVSAVQRNLKISKKDALYVINILVRLHILSTRYQIKIGSIFFPESYKKIYNIPEFVFDDGEEIKVDLEKDIFVFFVVSANE
ncbi:hypothetical protein ABIE01_000058 [Lactococcus lactis]